jgi:hypothetical protein
MDQVQRVDRLVSWLVSKAGGDPDAIGAVPADAIPARDARRVRM